MSDARGTCFSFDHFAFPYATNTDKDIAIGLCREIDSFSYHYQPALMATRSVKTILRDPIERSDFLFAVDLIEKASCITIIPDHETGISIATGFPKATQILKSEPPVLAVALSCEAAVRRYVEDFSDRSRIVDEKTLSSRLESEIFDYFSEWKEQLAKLGITPPSDSSRYREAIQNIPTILLDQDPAISSPLTLRTRLTSVIVVKPWHMRSVRGMAKEELSAVAKRIPGANIPLLCVAEEDLKSLKCKSERLKKKNLFGRCVIF